MVKLSLIAGGALGLLIIGYAAYLSYKNPQEFIDNAVILGIGAIIALFLIKQGSSR